MSPTDAETKGLEFSLRNAALAVLFFVSVRLGTGLARGIAEGNYAVGVLGLVLVLGPTLWLLVVIKEAYF